MDRRRKIQKDQGSRGDHVVILDQLESEVQRVLGELRRSRRETAILKNKMTELKGSLKEGQDAGELARLKKENHELRLKLDRIDQRAKEMLKRMDVIEEG